MYILNKIIVNDVIDLVSVVIYFLIINTVIMLDLSTIRLSESHNPFDLPHDEDHTKYQLPSHLRNGRINIDDPEGETELSCS